MKHSQSIILQINNFGLIIEKKIHIYKIIIKKISISELYIEKKSHFIFEHQKKIIWKK